MRLLEDEILITTKEIERLKKEYNLISVEFAGIFKEDEKVFEHLNKKEFLYNLKNPNYVRSLLDDEEKFRTRVEELYASNKYARRIYNKVFGKEEKTCTAEECISFRKKYKVSQPNFAKILGVTHKDIVRIEDGTRQYFNSKNVDIKYYINNPDEFVKKALEAKKKGIISNNAFEKIHCAMMEEKVKKKRQLEKNKKNEMTKQETTMKEKINNEQEERIVDQKIIESKTQLKNSKLSKTEYEKCENRIKRLRKNAKCEEREEFDGGKAKTRHREQFIDAVYDAYAAKVKLSMSDIRIVMNTILYHQELATNQALRVCILGALRGGNYEKALNNLNELAHELDKVKYEESLLEFKKILNERYRKARIQELREEGKKDSEIAVALRISINEVRRLTGENIER